MTTIHLQTLLIKAGVGFFFSFVALLDFRYIQFLLRQVGRQCFQTEIKRSCLLISALGNKANIVFFFHFRVSTVSGGSGGVCADRLDKLFQKEAGIRVLATLVSFEDVISLYWYL